MQKLIHTAKFFFRKISNRTGLAARLALDAVLPLECLGCGKGEELLCGRCLESIDRPELPKSGSVFAAAAYGDKFAKKAIWTLKYKKAKMLAEPLAELMYKRFFLGHQRPLDGRSLKKTKWIIVPVPLSKKRLRERGFNQSELIAERLAGKIRDREKIFIEVAANILQKTKDTPPQARVGSKEDRLANLQNAFSAENSHLMAGKNVIILDDVTTTGATLKEAKRTLREAGAKKIVCMVVAR